MKCGGLSDAKEITEQVKTFALNVKQNVEEKEGCVFEKYEPDSYKSQVVAGTNYFVKVLVDNDKCIHVRIYDNFIHNIVTYSKHVYKDIEDEINYF